MSDTVEENAIETPWPEWAKWLLWSALAAGAVYLLAKVLRRGGASELMGAAAPVMAMVVAGSAAAAEPLGPINPIERTELQAQLREIADQEPLIPPVRLCQALRDRGVEFNSEQHMARELRHLGLRSEVRTMKGRTERRWYDLTPYTNHADTYTNHE